MTAEYKVHGNVAVITLANPPVNGLGLSTRQGIVDGLNRPMQDAAVKSIVITGAGGAFSGGADIKEFGTDKSMQEPNLQSVIAAVENSPKPVVAAIHRWHGRWPGAGPGLPLPRGCPGCSVALPEVKLGILPGAGGTQRLPRVLGVEAALNMIVSGEAIKSEMIGMLPGQKLFDKLVASPEALAAEALGLCAERGRCAPAAAGTQPALQAPPGRRVLPVRAQHGQGHEQELPCTRQVRGRRRGCHQAQICRWPAVRA
jgi:3-hydroxyacyl-CoA dehydrogenase